MAAQDSNPYGLIYLVTNTINGKRYVGQTTDSVGRRWAHHCSKTSRCKALYAAIIKHGKNAFNVEVLAFGSGADELNLLEAQYVARYQSVSPNGYNLKEGGGSKGKWSAEMRGYLTAKANSPQNIARLSGSSVAMWKNDAVRKRISDAIRVGLSNEEVRRRRSEIAKIACNTQEVKARMSEAQKIRFQDPNQCEAISKRQRELLKDPAHRERLKIAGSKAKEKPGYREKISNHLKRLWNDAEYREKMLASQRVRRAREKLLKEQQ